MDKRVLETAEKLALSLGLAVVGHLQKPFPLPELKGVLEAVAAMEAPEVVKVIPAFAVSDKEIRDAVKYGEFLKLLSAADQPEDRRGDGRGGVGPMAPSGAGYDAARELSVAA